MSASVVLFGMLAPLVWMGVQRPRRELDRLFARLRTAAHAADARAISEQIWHLWMQHPDAEVQAWMQQGVEAMTHQRYEDARPCFDAIIASDPDYAEGWNKRATVHYLTGHYAEAVRDIKRTLALEARHFGAWAGLGSIYLLIAHERGALAAFEAVLAINPHLISVQQQVRALRDEQSRDDD